MTITQQAPESRVFAGVELRDVETTDSFSMLKGRAVPYGEFTSIGYFMESFARGSLGKSIKEAARDLPLNVFHENRMWPIGAANDWAESDGGLDGVWRLDDSDMAQNAARLAKSGMLTGLSIEFVPIRFEREYAEEWDPARGPDFMDKVTHIEARLCATGLVQSPAYVSAGVKSVRSATTALRDLVHVALDVRRSTPDSAPTTPQLDAVKARAEALRNA